MPVPHQQPTNSHHKAHHNKINKSHNVTNCYSSGLRQQAGQVKSRFVTAVTLCDRRLEGSAACARRRRGVEAHSGGSASGDDEDDGGRALPPGTKKDGDEEDDGGNALPL